jgi:hypothetical protein
VILRRLLCIALLLAIPALAQQSSSPVAPALPASQLSPSPSSPVTEIKVECLPASRASELIGKHGCVAGKVFRVSALKNGATHLSLCPPKSECSFHAAVLAHDRETVGDISYLHGKLVALVGDVTSYRGDPEIIVRDSKQIHVASGAPPKEFDAARAKPSGKSMPGSKRDRAW